MLFKPPGSSRRSFCTLTFELAGRFEPELQPRQEQPGISSTNVPHAPGQPVPRTLQEIISGLGGRFEPSLLSPPTPALLPASATGISSLSRLPSPSQRSGYQLLEAPVGVLGAAEPVLTAAAPGPRCRHRQPLPGPGVPAGPPGRGQPAQQRGHPSPRHVTSPAPRFVVKHPQVTRSWHAF